MMEYFDLLNLTQRKNIQIITYAMEHSGITNILTKAAILAVVSKECNFLLRNEVSYRNTPNERIRAIFGTHFSGMSDETLTLIKQNDEEFFNDVYGGMYGNDHTEGYKYRGRGFNEITFKGNYASLSRKIGVDLVSDPDKLNVPEIAAVALIQYFKDRFSSADEHVKQDIHAKDINDFTTIEDALIGVYRANAGWGKRIFPDTTGGFAKAHDRVNGFLEMLKTK